MLYKKQKAFHSTLNRHIFTRLTRSNPSPILYPSRNIPYRDINVQHRYSSHPLFSSKPDGQWRCHVRKHERCSQVLSDTFRASTPAAQRKRPAFRTSMAKKESEDAMIAASVRVMMLKLLTRCWKMMMTKMPSALSPTKSVERRLSIGKVLCWTYQTVQDHLLEAVDAD